MKIKNYRSLIVDVKNNEFYIVLWAVMLLAKNIYNSTLFILHNIISSYTYHKESQSYIQKEVLHQSQIEAIHLLNQTLDKINQQRLVKYKKKLEKESKKDNPKVIKQFIPLILLTKQVPVKEFQKIILDPNIIENALKLKESINKDNKEYVDYTSIHSFVAQYAVYKAVENTSNYFKSLREYFKNYQQGQLANVPKLPKYLGKNERLTI